TLVTTGQQVAAGSSDNTYEIQWGAVDQNNYTVSDGVLGTLTVSKADLATATIAVSGTYVVNGEEHVVSFTVSVNPPMALSVADWYVVSGDRGTNPDTYTLTIAANAESLNWTGTAQTDWVIENKEFTITFDSAGGSPVAPIVAYYGTAVLAPEAPTREGYTFAGWLPEVPSTMPVDGETCVAQWDANEYTITVIADPGQSKVFGEGDPAISYTHSGSLELVFTGALSREAGEDVGEYAITIGTLYVGENYYIVLLDGTFSITPFIGALDVTVETGPVVYDGTPQEPAVTVTDSNGNVVDPSQYVVSYSDNTGAGTATVTVTPAEGGNYAGPGGSGTFVIEKAPSNADMSDVALSVTEFRYDGAEKSVSVVGLPDGVTAAVVSGGSATEPGTYEAVIAFESADPNYEAPPGMTLEWAIVEYVTLSIEMSKGKGSAVVVDGHGNVLTPEDDGTYLVPKDTQVKILVTPDDGFKIKDLPPEAEIDNGWMILEVESDLDIVALLSPDLADYNLVVNVSGDGGFAIDSDDDGRVYMLFGKNVKKVLLNGKEVDVVDGRTVIENKDDEQVFDIRYSDAASVELFRPSFWLLLISITVMLGTATYVTRRG
ncbi:MAG: hypothetical protein GX224_05820, partial [Thermoplasmatales archaeon]|nr:hypothetical protein [Thermoplasmatales archaeon]